MSYEDVYREFMVERTETVSASRRSVFHCDLVGHDQHRVSFQLITQGCVGEDEYAAQHKAIAPHCTIGALWHCSIVYRRRYSAFVMCIADIMPLQAFNCSSGGAVSAKQYLDPNRGFWVRTEALGSWAELPRPIELGGKSHVPVRALDNPPFVGCREIPTHELALRNTQSWPARLLRRLSRLR